MSETWIQHPVVLYGNHVDLLPLEESHFEALYSAAADKELWRLVPIDCSVKDTFYTMYHTALLEREAGKAYPFVIFYKEKNQLIGSTRLFDVSPADKKLEIGWTWISKPYWGTKVNPECKYLLLQYCFEILEVNRVQLKTKDTNFRSRKAIEKIGGVFEGILRKDRIQEDGTSRNAAYYSILNEEWPLVRERLAQRLASD